MLGLIQSLAIVVHFPLMNVPIPANVQVINDFLVPIVTFDILDELPILKVLSFEDLK